MYKRPLFFYFIIILVVLFSQNSVKVAASNAPDLYISEVWHNYVIFGNECRFPENTSNTSFCSADTWVEITNKGQQNLDLSGYQIDIGAKTKTKINQLIIPANSSFILQNKHFNKQGLNSLNGFISRSYNSSSQLIYLDILNFGTNNIANPGYSFKLLKPNNEIVDSFSKSEFGTSSSIQFCWDEKSGQKIIAPNKSSVNIDGKTFYATPGNQNDCPKPADIAPPPPPVIETPTPPAVGLNPVTQTTTILDTVASVEIENKVETTKTIDEVVKTVFPTVINQSPQTDTPTIDLKPEVQTQTDSNNSNLQSKEDESKIINSQPDNLTAKNASLVETETKMLESVGIDVSKTLDKVKNITGIFTETIVSDGKVGVDTIVATDNNNGGNPPPGLGDNEGSNSSSSGSGSDNITNTSNGSTNGFILIQSENKIETRSVNEVKLVELAVKESNSNPQTLVATVSDDDSNPPGSLTQTVEQETKSKTQANYLANNVIEVELQSTNNSSDFAFVQQSVVINPQITPSVVNQSQSFVLSKSDSSSKVTLDMHSVKSGFIYFDLVLIIFLLTKSVRENSISISSIAKSARSLFSQKK
jgi:hypothetical protein